MTENLKDFTFPSILFRLFLAMLSGAVIGFGRSRKNRNAGQRTYMLISMGSALTILISIYEYHMIYGQWLYASEFSEVKFDGSRFSAQVINGIGFIAGGTILSSRHQQFSGLTSAIGIFVSACLGIMAGSGFYEGVAVSIVTVIIVLEILQPIEILCKRKIRNITVFIEFESVESINGITDSIRERGAEVREIDIEPESGSGLVSAVISIRMNRKNSSHSEMLSSLAQLDYVYSIHEIIT